MEGRPHNNPPSPQPTIVGDPVVMAFDNMVPGLNAMLLAAWIACEGGMSHNNPLNVSAPLDHSWSYPGQNGFWNDLGDGMGVVTFDTIDDGVAANVQVLKQPNMAPIYEALQFGDAAHFAAQFPGSWGTDPACLREKLGI